MAKKETVVNASTDDETPAANLGAKSEETKSDLKVEGNPDNFKTIHGVSSESEKFASVTKAIQVKNGGCIVVTESVSEHGAASSTIYVPNVSLGTDDKGFDCLISN